MSLKYHVTEKDTLILCKSDKDCGIHKKDHISLPNDLRSIGRTLAGYSTGTH